MAALLVDKATGLTKADEASKMSQNGKEGEVSVLAGLVMSGNTPVAQFSGRVVTPILPERVPLCFMNGGDLEEWLKMRAVDQRRKNGRILKRLLRLGDTSDLNTALRVHGAKITDNYWFKTVAEQDLKWEDVRFSQDYFADVALQGSIDTFTRHYTPEQLHTPTPELTNTGSFEKCWRLIDGQWVMLKQGSENELFSEIFVSELGKKLGFQMADYRIIDGCAATEHFTKGQLNFEPMAYLSGENGESVDNYKVLKRLHPGLEREYLDILFMDALVYNVDRHTQNFGILRDGETGAILSMAPNFDNNIALISGGYTADPVQTYNRMANMFRKLLDAEGISYQFPALAESLVRDVASEVMPGTNIDREYVVKFVMANFRKLTR